MKKAEVAKKMFSGLKDPWKNKAKEALAHTMRKRRGAGSLNPVQKSKDNMVMESKNEVENN